RLARPRSARRGAAPGSRYRARTREHAAAVRRSSRLASYGEPISLAPDASGADVRLGGVGWTWADLSTSADESLLLGFGRVRRLLATIWNPARKALISLRHS